MANFNLNKILLGGRLTSDPVLKTFPDGTHVVRFTLAVTRRHNKDVTDFLDCVAWREEAIFINRFFRKGSTLCVAGALHKRSWNAQDGSTRWTTEVSVDEAMFVDSKGEYESDTLPGNEEPEYYDPFPVE